jgi:hypothetical protein
MREEMITLVCAKQILITVGMVMGAASVDAATIVTFADQKDAMIFGTPAGADTGNSSGKGPGMFAGADGSLNRKRSLIQFDVAGNVPAGAHITSATLTLYLGQIAGSGGGGSGGSIPSRTLSLFDVQQDWGEGDSGLVGSPPATSPNLGGSGQGYARVTGDSGWDYANFDSANTATGKWNAGGPDLHGGNVAAAASATSTFTAPFTLNNPYAWSSSGLASDVQQWLDAPSSNHGWMLEALTGLDTNNNVIALENTAQSFLGFWTRDGAAANSNPALTPTLTVTYEVPEPGTCALLLLSAPLLMKRRRGR